MNPNEPLQGLWCATLSPLDQRGAFDAARLANHAQRLFAAGVDGIAPFGTTGEGQSFSVAERRAGLDALIAAGIAPERILAATGCAALPDAIELTRHALAAGCAGALVLPPFFFKDVTDEGIYAAYAALIDGVGDDRLRLYLYHIPQVSGVGLSVAMVSRLAAAYPGRRRRGQGQLGQLRQLARAGRRPARSCRFSSVTSRICRRCASWAARERSAASPICIRA